MPEALLSACSQEELRCTYFLWQLFHIDYDLTKARQRMAKESKAMEAAARSGILAEKEIEAKKKEQAGFHLERIKLERHLKRRRTESDQKVTDCRIGWLLGALMNASSGATSSTCLLHTCDLPADIERASVALPFLNVWRCLPAEVVECSWHAVRCAGNGV